MSLIPIPPSVLAGMLAAALVLGLRGLALYRSARDRRAFVDDDLLERMAPGAGPVRRALAAVMVAAAVGLLTAALVAGSFGERAETGDDGTGFETVLVLDASNSMLAEDARPSRLRLEQLLARRMIGRVAGRIGIVYFAGSGYVLSPLTEDRAATLMFAEAVHPTHVGRGGTSVVDGLEQALVVLAGGRPNAVRSVVLFSDGESTVDEDQLALVLERARRASVSIHTVGMGTVDGARIPMPIRDEDGWVALRTDRPNDIGPGDGRRWLRDSAGRVVVTRLDEAGLRQIAAATGGLFVTGAPAADALLERMPAGGARPPVSTVAVNGLLLSAFLLLLLEAYAMRRA
ncbi:MAG: vWA domain-containing protein [Gemmatimonadota bacterium]